eukprot:4083576-Ditylum_brightwellii.AAC.1
MTLAAPAISTDELYKNTLTEKMQNNKGEITKEYRMLRPKKEKVICADKHYKIQQQRSCRLVQAMPLAAPAI